MPPPHACARLWLQDELRARAAAEEEAARLRGALETAEAEADKRLRALRQAHERAVARYEARIAQLQAGAKGKGKASGERARGAQPGGRVAELEQEVARVREFFQKKVKALKERIATLQRGGGRGGAEGEEREEGDSARVAQVRLCVRVQRRACDLTPQQLTAQARALGEENSLLHAKAELLQRELARLQQAPAPQAQQPPPPSLGQHSATQRPLPQGSEADADVGAQSDATDVQPRRSRAAWVERGATAPPRGPARAAEDTAAHELALELREVRARLQESEVRRARLLEALQRVGEGGGEGGGAAARVPDAEVQAMLASFQHRIQMLEVRRCAARRLCCAVTSACA